MECLKKKKLSVPGVFEYKKRFFGGFFVFSESGDELVVCRFLKNQENKSYYETGTFKSFSRIALHISLENDTIHTKS